MGKNVNVGIIIEEKKKSMRRDSFSSVYGNLGWLWVGAGPEDNRAVAFLPSKQREFPQVRWGKGESSQLAAVPGMCLCQTMEK